MFGASSGRRQRQQAAPLLPLASAVLGCCLPHGARPTTQPVVLSTTRNGSIAT